MNQKTTNANEISAIDELDKGLIAALSDDGRKSVLKLSEGLNVTSPTVQSRLKRLIGFAKVRICCLVDISQIKGATIAIIGITLDKYHLDKKLEEIAAMNQVNWCAVVTGHYDVIAEITTLDGMQGLYRFLSEDLNKIGGIKSSETFVVIKAKRKWTLLPKGIKENWMPAK